MRVVRRSALVALGFVLALVALEVALQVAAAVLRAEPGREVRAAAPGAADGVRTVLCVGDSFTFGFGCDDPAQAYPRRLEARLRAARPDAGWRVVNGGWSGNASPQLLESLPGQLDRHRPDFVCVLIGINDFWRGEEVGFELRTVKLAKLVWLWLTTGKGPSEHRRESARAAPSDAVGALPVVPAAPPPFVGTWHAGDVWVEFAADGRLLLSHGELGWVERDGVLVLQWPAGEEERLDWRLDDEILTVDGGPFPGPLRLARGRPLRHDVDRGRRALESGDPEAAAVWFEAALSEPRLASDARVGLVEAAVARGAEDTVERQLASLREIYRAASGAAARRRAGAALVDAALLAGDARTAVATACDLAELDPEGRWLGLIVVHGLAVEDRAPIAATLTRIAGRVDVSVEARAAAMAGLVDLRREAGDAAGALAWLFEGHALHATEDVVEHAVHSRPAFYDRAALDGALAQLRAAGADAERLAVCEALWRAGHASGGATLDQLERNLERLVAACREAGAEPLFLTYPMPRPRIEAVTRRLAGALSVDVIDLRPAFDALLPELGHEALFILDGHPSARGYDLMAEVVADALRDR